MGGGLRYEAGGVGAGKCADYQDLIAVEDESLRTGSLLV